MPPKEYDTGKVNSLFVQYAGKETEIPAIFQTPTAEEMFRDIKEMFQMVRQENPVPTYIVSEIDCKPKRIKEAMEDLRIQILAKQQTIEKYRNHKIPRRKRMVRKASRMRKYHVFLIADVPAKDIELTFSYKKDEEAGH